MNITLVINGERQECQVEAGEKLLDTLRGLGFLGVKKGCGEGTCGTCVVIMDGRLVNACMVFSAAADGTEITTVEGLGSIDSPHPIQTEFVKAGAVQCGYCTPGMVLATKALLDRVQKPNDEQIRAALDGNLCRCTGYVKIIEAVKNAADVLASQGGMARRGGA